MRPEVLLAELEEDLFVGLVGPDESLEGEDEVRVIVEDVVAERSEFLEVIAKFFAEKFLLTVDVAV